ncbi:DEAD/DEAH box helicase [Tabrizicola soli]|uniref:DEAD/DEAH box helicase n=1 Tax=Tabrizicola soli TaxID=2185115 RepID=UPI0036350217
MKVKPVIGAKVTHDGRRAVVMCYSPTDHETCEIRFANAERKWLNVKTLVPNYVAGDHVRHVGSKALKGRGTGMVLSTRDVIGFHQVLVQFFDSGESHWMDWRLLGQANSAETRITYRAIGKYGNAAERMRMRTLAKALSIWDANTGAFGRLDIDPLPHQLDVARKVVTSPQARWLIADDVGLGKTIEVGLILHALTMRNRCRRTLIVCPSSLTKQWKDEMRVKFNRSFEIYNRDFKPEFASEVRARENIIISLDLAKRPEHKEMLLGRPFDVIVFDEAHRLGVDEGGTRTERFNLAEALNTTCHAFLMLTATPHQGKTRRFRALLELTRPDLVGELAHLEADPSIVREVIIRNRKSMVTDAQGKLIFKGHDTLRYTITPPQKWRPWTQSCRPIFGRLPHWVTDGKSLPWCGDWLCNGDLSQTGLLLARGDRNCPPPPSGPSGTNGERESRTDAGRHALGRRLGRRRRKPCGDRYAAPPRSLFLRRGGAGSEDSEPDHQGQTA